MDVRLSPEQVALRDSVAQVADHLGPGTVGRLDDAERVLKLDAAVAATGWRDLRAAAEDGHPWASGVEVAVVAEQLGRRLAEAAFLGPTLAADLRRRADAPPSTETETVVLAAGLDRLATVDDLPGGVAVDGRGATGALALRPTPAGHELVRVPVAVAPATTDLTRPPATIVGPVETDVVGTRALSDDDLAAWTALGLATTSADLVGTMTGAVDLSVDHAAAGSSTGGQSARSRPSSTSSPTPSSPPRGRAASPATRPGPSMRSPRPTRWPPRRRPRRTAPAPPARCARPPSRSTAASATPGSAWPTCTCGGPCSPPTCSAAPAPTSAASSPTTGSEPDRGLR